MVFLYHMRFLFHIAGMETLNLPFFLLKSLTNMLAKIRTQRAASEYSLYHQYLIKLLVEEEIRKINQSWDHFLFYRACQPAPTPYFLAQLSLASQKNPQPTKRTKRNFKKENIHKRLKVENKRFLQSRLRRS